MFCSKPDAPESSVRLLEKLRDELGLEESDTWVFPDSVGRFTATGGLGGRQPLEWASRVHRIVLLAAPTAGSTRLAHHG